MTPIDAPYILDNGCYAAAQNDEAWNPDGFFDRLAEINERMARDPDFVVLPDFPSEPDVTFQRSVVYAPDVADFDYDYYLPVQGGIAADHAVSVAQDIGAAGLFIGGSREFKYHKTAAFVRAAREEGLGVHIGEPGTNLSWAEDMGVDSVDTTTIVRNQQWERLHRLEQSRESSQERLSSYRMPLSV